MGDMEFQCRYKLNRYDSIHVSDYWLHCEYDIDASNCPTVISAQGTAGIDALGNCVTCDDADGMANLRATDGNARYIGDLWVNIKDTNYDRSRTDNRSWTDAEREGFRKLLRAAGILFIAIVIAGTIAALLSSALGTL